jgi:hypothetical protein
LILDQTNSNLFFGVFGQKGLPLIHDAPIPQPSKNMKQTSKRAEEPQKDQKQKDKTTI